MEKTTLPGLHVILGDSAAGTFRSVFHAGAGLLIDQDVLSCGPTPRCASLEEWSRVRHEYWHHLVPDDGHGHVHSPDNLIDNAARLRDAERVTIWAATGVSEQLFVAGAVHLAEKAALDPSRLRMVLFDSVPGVGALNEEEFRAHPEPQPFSEPSRRAYLAAWDALTSPDPDAMLGFTDAHPEADPHLKRAMQLMLRRYPDRKTGLPFWDRQLLRAVQTHGPRAMLVIADALGIAWHDGDLVGDAHLFGRLLKLADANLPKPLVKSSGNPADMRATEFELTPFGRDVLEGRACSYPTNPIDEWVGGVHVTSLPIGDAE